MINEVYLNIYLNKIPQLTINPKSFTNSYIILSKPRNIVIDTGYNQKESREAIMQGIQELKINLYDTDIILTHFHNDHSGLASYLAQKGATVYMGANDIGWMVRMARNRTKEMTKIYQGLYPVHNILPQGSIYNYNQNDKLNLHPLTENDLIKVGDYQFQVVDIPGHTPGHIGLLEKKHKLFFGGDHILEKINPIIFFMGFKEDILGLYLHSLKKIYNFDIEILFTGHNDIIDDHRKRINQILAHYQKRLNYITALIANGEKTPHDIAARIKWNTYYEDWDQFPSPQQFSCIGIVISHVEHLVHSGKAERLNINGNFYYKLI